MHIPCVIVGGGIIGLGLAYELCQQMPSLEFALFEKNPFPGEEASSRNSGVLHAGLYYPAESLKRKYCLLGIELWKQWASQLNIGLNQCGKYIVARDGQEAEIEQLFELASKHGVKDLQWCETDFLQDICHVSKAFFSPHTAVINLSEAIRNLANYVEGKDIPVMYNNSVVSIQRVDGKFHIATEHEELTCDFLFNCAGLYSIPLRQQLGFTDLEPLYVKGHYLRYSKSYYNQSLVYPLPETNLKGLGVHTSFDFDGVIRFGPNTQEVSQLDYQFDADAFDKMVEVIEQTFKGIDREKLCVDYCGIRSKIKNYHDFWITYPDQNGIEGYFEFCGIDSPGFTSAPAIAREAVKKLIQIGA